MCVLAGTVRQQTLECRAHNCHGLTMSDAEGVSGGNSTSDNHSNRIFIVSFSDLSDMSALHTSRNGMQFQSVNRSQFELQSEQERLLQQQGLLKSLNPVVQNGQINADIQQPNSAMHPTLPTLEGYVALNGGHTNGQLLRRNNLSNSSPQLNNTGQTYTQVPVNGQSIIQHGRNNGTVHHMPHVVQNAYAPQTVTRFKNAYGSCRNRNNNSSMSTLPASSSSNGTLYQTNINGNTQLQNLQNHQGLAARAVRGLPLQNLGWKSSGGQHRIDHEREEIADLIGLKGLQGRVENNQISRTSAKNISTTSTQQTAASVSDVGHYMGHFKLPNAKGKAGKTTPFAKKRMPQSSSKYDIPPSPSVVGISPDFWEYINSPAPAQQQEEEEDVPTSTGASSFWVCDPVTWQQEQEKQRRNSKPDHVASGSFIPVTSHALAQTPIQVSSDGTVTLNPTYTAEDVTAHNGRHPTSQCMVYPTEDVTTVTTLCSGTKAAATCSSVLSGTQSGVNGGTRQREYVSIADPSIQTDIDEDEEFAMPKIVSCYSLNPQTEDHAATHGAGVESRGPSIGANSRERQGKGNLGCNKKTPLVKVIPVPTTKRGRRKSELNVQTVVSDDSLARTIAKTKVMLGWGESTIEPSTSDRPHSASPQATSPMMGDQPARSRHISTELCKTKKQKGKGTKGTKSPKLRNKLKNVQSCPLANWISSTQTVEPTMNVLSSPTDQTAASNTQDVTEKHHSVLTLHKTGGVWQATPGGASDSLNMSASNAPSNGRSSGSFSHVPTTRVSKTSYRPVHTGETVASQRVRAASLDSPLLSASNSNSNVANVIKSSVYSQKVHTNPTTKPNYASDITPPSDQPLDFTKMKTRPNLTKVKATYQDEVQDAPLNLKCPLPDAPLDYSMKTLRKKEEADRKGVGELKKHKEAEEITGALNLTAERPLHRAPLVATSLLSSPAPSANSVATLSSDSEFPFRRRSELDSESSEECLSTEGLDTDTSQNDDVAMVKSLEKVITVSAEASPEKEHTEGTLGAPGSLDTHVLTQEGTLGTLVSLNKSSTASHETLVTPGIGGTSGAQGSLDTQGTQVGDIPDTFNLQTLCCVALSRLSSYTTDGDAKSNEPVLPTVPTPSQPEQGVSASGDSAQKTSQSETVPRDSEGRSSQAGKTEKSLSAAKLAEDPSSSPAKAKLISTLSNLLSVRNKLPPGGTVTTTPDCTAAPQSTNHGSSSTPKPKYPMPATLSEAYSDISDSDNEDRITKKARPGQSKLASAGPSTPVTTLVAPVNTGEADSAGGGTTDKRLISILFVQNAAKGPQGNKDGQDATDLQDEPLKKASDSQDAEKQSHHPDVPHPISRVEDASIETSAASSTTLVNSKASKAVGQQQQVTVASSPTQATAGTSSPNVSPSKKPKNVTLRIPMTPDRVKKIKEITNKTKQNEKSSSSTSSNNSQNQPAEKADGVCDLPVTTGNDRAETSNKKPDSGTKGVPNEAETTSLTESEIDVRPASVSEQKPDEDVVQNKSKDISTVSEQNLEKESRSCPVPTSESDNPLTSDQNYDSDVSECPLVIDEARTSSQSSSKRARKKRKAAVSNGGTASSSVETSETEKESSDQSENIDRTQDSNLEELKNGENVTEEKVDQVEGIPESDSAKDTDRECLTPATNPPIFPQDNIPTHTSPIVATTDKQSPEIKSPASINTKDTDRHRHVQSTQVVPVSRTAHEHNSASSSMETTVPICRLDSTEMTDNFSIISNNTVINIRPESLDVVIEAKRKRKAKKARADNIFAAIGEPELLLDEEASTVADASSSDDMTASNDPVPLQDNDTAEAVDLAATARQKDGEKATEKPSTPSPKATSIVVPTPVTRLGQENDSLEMQEECCNEYDNMYLNNSQTSSELHDGLEATTAEAGVPEPNPGSNGEGFEPPSAKISDDQDEDEASTVDKDKKKRSVNGTEQDTEIEAEESAKNVSDAEKASETLSPVSIVVKAERNDTKDDEEDLFAPFTAIKVKKERMSFDSDSTPFKRKTPRKHGYHVSDAHAHAHVETSGIRAKRRRLVKKIDDSAEKKTKSPKVSPKKAMSYILLSDSSESSDETEIIMSRPRGRVMPKKSAAKTTDNDKSKTEDLLKRVKTEPNDQIAPFSSRASITACTTPAATPAENSETKDDEKATEEPTENPVATPRSNSNNSNNFRLHSDKEDPKASVEKAEIDENLAPLCALARMAAATSPAVPKSLANLSVDISQKSATEVIKVKPFSSDPYDFQEEKKEPVSIDISECVAKNKVSPRVIKLKSLSSTLSPEKYKSNGLKRNIKSPILLKKRRFASGSSKRLESYSERRNQKGVKKILIQSSIFGKKKTSWPFRKKAKGLAQVYSKKGWRKSGVQEPKATSPDLKEEERGKKRKLEETVKEQDESLEKVPKQEISPEQEKDSLKALVDEIIAACPFKTPRKSLLSTAPESSPEAQSDSTLSADPASPPTPPREQRSPPTEPIPQQAEKPVEAAQPGFGLPLKPQPLSASYTRTARMGHWGKRKIPPVPKHPAPLMPHVKPEKISKAAMEESIYLTMQKLLNGALILDQRPNRGRFPQPSWNTCFDSLKAVAKPDPVAPRQTQINPSLPPTPPPPSPPKPVRHFESTGIVATRRGYIRWVCEENVRLKPCFVKMVQLRIKSKTVKIHRCK